MDTADVPSPLVLPSATLAPTVPQILQATSLQKQLSKDEWCDLRPLIRHLYIAEKKTFLEVADILAKEYGFRPT